MEISKKANVFFPSLSHKTPSCNVSVFFLQYSQAHRSSSFRKYFLSVVSYTDKYSFHVRGNLLATDYIYIVDLKKKSCRLPPAQLLSPDRADMDCGIDSLSSQLPPHHSFEVNLWGIDSRNFLSFCSRKVLKTDLES